MLKTPASLCKFHVNVNARGNEAKCWRGESGPVQNFRSVAKIEANPSAFKSHMRPLVTSCAQLAEKESTKVQARWTP